MAKVFIEDLDGRDNIAESVFQVLTRKSVSDNFEALARRAYDAAEAFLAERERRIDQDANDDREDNFD